MGSDFVSELSFGLFFTAYSAFCIFGRKVFYRYSVKQNEEVLAQLKRNPLPAKIAMCLFGTLLMCGGVAEGLFDKIAVAKDGLWPALFIVSMGVLFFIWAKHIVQVQTFSLRMCRNPLTDWAGNIAMILMGSITGCLGVYALIGLFFTK